MRYLRQSRNPPEPNLRSESCPEPQIWAKTQSPSAVGETRSGSTRVPTSLLSATERFARFLGQTFSGKNGPLSRRTFCPGPKRRDMCLACWPRQTCLSLSSVPKEGFNLASLGHLAAKSSILRISRTGIWPTPALAYPQRSPPWKTLKWSPETELSE